MEIDLFRQNIIDNILMPIINSLVKSVYRQCLVVNSFLYILADESILFVINLAGKIDNNISFEFDIIEGKVANPNPNANLYNKVMEVLSNTTHTNKIIYDNPELSNDTEFMKLATSKVSEGAGFYFMDTSICNTFIPVFNGLPLLNKADKVSIKLFDLGNNKIMVNLNVFKKKLGCNYDIYYYILNVNRPLR